MSHGDPAGLEVEVEFGAVQHVLTAYHCTSDFMSKANDANESLRRS